MSNLKRFILENENWEELLTSEPYNLAIKRDGDYIIFKYSMIDSDLSLPEVQEARGIIFRENDWKIVCRPFDKFFNIQEGAAAEIDWSTAKVTEKRDCSLIKIWNDRGIWNVSTNGTIFAINAEVASENPIGSTFYDLFMYAAREQKLSFDILDEDYTYLFELCSPYTKIVVHHEDTRIVHIGTRHNDLGAYVNKDAGVEKVREYDISHPRAVDMIDMADDLPFDEEGYVVKDAFGGMIKVKSPAYVAAHRMVNNRVVTTARILDIITLGEMSEFLSCFPEYTEPFEDVLSNIVEVEADADYIIRHLQSKKFKTRKELALWAQETEIPSFVFSYVDGHVKDFDEWFSNCTENKRLKVLGY